MWVCYEEITKNAKTVKYIYKYIYIYLTPVYGHGPWHVLKYVS